MISPMIAAKAYAQVQGSGSALGGGGLGGGGAIGAGPSFADVLKTTVDGAVNASRHAEHQMAAHANGKAELVNVVTAVASAESSLETVMAVRDQVIQAYQEIMRMPI